MKGFVLAIATFFIAAAGLVAQNLENQNYPFGYLPNSASNADPAAAYNSWKNNYVSSCGGGVYRVNFDDPSKSVSEGIAYGMLLTALADDQAIFDGLWTYYQQFPTEYGAMHWKIDGCSTVEGTGGAADAEYDAAYALIVAHNRWGSAGAVDYATAAGDLIGTIRHYETEAATFHPWPGDMWEETNVANPCYFSPGYYRLWGSFTNQESFWSSVADQAYGIIDANLSANGAAHSLVSDWCRKDGSYLTGELATLFAHGGQRYAYDACRTPWRIATDYAWYGTPEAQSYSQKAKNFVSSKGGIQNIVDGYYQNGQAFGSAQKSAFTGGFACAGLATGQSDVDGFYNHFKNMNPSGYYDQSLHAIYLFFMTGNMWNPIDGLTFERVTGITSAIPQLDLDYSESVTLSAQVVPVNATIKSITWVSSDTAVVKVNARTGVVTPNGIGSATLTAHSTDGDFTYSVPTTITGTIPVPDGYAEIPGRVEAEDFAAQFGTQTEACSEGGQNVGYLDQGDYLTYHIYANVAGDYEVDLRVASDPGTGAYNMKLDGQTVFSGTVGSTGGWQSWVTQTKTITGLSAGPHTLRFEVTGDGFNLNYLDFASQAPVQLTGVEVNPLSATINLGETYQIQYAPIPANATNPVWEFNAHDGAIATVDDNGLVTAHSVGTTQFYVGSGGFHKVFTITVENNIPSHVDVVPGRVEAEDYEAMSGIQTENTSDQGGGQNVGWTTAGDWMEYEIYADYTGDYDVNVRVASDQGGAGYQLLIDGEVVAQQNVGSTGGWQSWMTQDLFIGHMDEGYHTLRVNVLQGGFNMNYINFNYSAPIAVTGVALDPTAASIELGQTITLTETVTPANAADKSVYWSSSDEAVITVDQNGVVTGVGLGTALARVLTTDGYYLATAEITVTPVAVTGVNIWPYDFSIEVGNGYPFSATVLPANAANQNISWSSSDEAIATIDASGQMTTHAVGTADITVTTADGGFTSSTTVTVTPPPVAVTGITLSETFFNMEANDVRTSVASVVPANATNQNISWVSRDESVATVDNGVISGVAPGYIYVVATTEDGGFADSVYLAVLPIRVDSIEFNIEEITLNVGEMYQINPSVWPGNAANTSLSYMSNNWDAYNVNGSGLITALVPGSGQIWANPVYGVGADLMVVNVVFDLPATTDIIPGRVEAEDYDNMNGIQTEPTSDNGGGTNVGWLDAGDWLDYDVFVEATADYDVDFRVASSSGGGSYELRAGSTVLASGTVPSTGGWQNWITQSVTDVPLTLGEQTLRLYVVSGGFNLNYMDFTESFVPVLPVAVSTNPSALVMDDGTSATIVATVHGNPTDPSVTWSSLDESVATVDANGNVQAVGPGFTHIRVQTVNPDVSDLVSVLVNEVPLEGIEIAPRQGTIGDGETRQLEVIYTPANASNKNVTWSSAFPNNISVDQNGFIEAIGSGLSTITVRSGEGPFIDQLFIDVIPVLVTDIVPSHGFIEITVGETINVSANALPSNASNPTTSWRTDDASIVTVNGLREVTGVSVGSTNIVVFANDGSGVEVSIPVTVTEELVIPPGYDVIPGGTIEAEDFADMSGIQTENCSEGGLNIGWLDAGDWMDYNVAVLTDGTYEVEFRVASQMSGGRLQIRSGNSILASLNMPNTGGWQNWTTISTSVDLTAGLQTLRLHVDNGPFNINYFTTTEIFGKGFVPKTVEDVIVEELRAPKVYPTVINGGHINIDLGGHQQMPIRIVSLTGAVIYNGQSNGQSMEQISASDLAKGMYYVFVGDQATKVLVK